MDLTVLDELKFVAAIQRTTRSDAGRLVLGMKSGTSMMQLFENTYRQVGEIQRENMRESLLALRYNGGFPIDHVTRLKTVLREYESTGRELAPDEVLTLFKVSIKEKAKKWHRMVSSIARFQRWSTEQLYQDYLASF